MTISVHIERLVLDGLPVERRHGTIIRQAVEAELGRLVSERGLGAGFTEGGAVDRVPAGTITIGSRPQVGAMGRQIATAIFGSLHS